MRTHRRPFFRVTTCCAVRVLQSILELARSWGEFKVSERPFTMAQLVKAVQEKRVRMHPTPAAAVTADAVMAVAAALALGLLGRCVCCDQG